jgi:SH3-like domain-containing protein
LKRFLILILALAFLVAVFPFGNANAAFFEEATVIADEVNMRLRPTTDAPVVTVLEKGTRLGVYCEEQPGWYRVIYGNYRGYVSCEFIFLASTDSLVGHVKTDNLEVRQFSNEFSEVMGKLTAGNAVEILDIVGDWYYLETDEAKGYVNKSGIELSKSRSTASLLKPGMRGVAVADMQRELRKRGFFSGSVTGYYGDLTLGAVKSFQSEANLSQDGIVGEKTLDLLYGDNNIKTTAAKKAGIQGAVTMPHWDTVNKKWKRGTYAIVTDVKTGIQYKVYRFGGWWHADCEPATAEDTKKMKKAAGGAWTWNRRPVWVTVNGVTYAASQHSMPHMVDPVKGNDFPGHFCIHFLHSKIHHSAKECPRHQENVRYAYNKAK